eukprot:35314-Chlamydomonas_euryale.AAC.2
MRAVTAAATPLGPVPPEVLADADALREASALRMMWSSNPYSGAASATASGAPWDPSFPDDVQAMIERAEEDNWRQYEDGASAFVEQLAAALSVGDSAAGGTGGGNTGGGGAVWGEASGSASGSQPTLALRSAAGAHGLSAALSLMDDTLASSLDRSKLTGLDVDSYGPALAGVMDRLMVAPMTTKYLFWKKVWDGVGACGRAPLPIEGLGWVWVGASLQ